MEWELKFVAYCGMTFPIGRGTFRQMQQRATEYLARHRRPGSPLETQVSRLDGYSWEVCEPEDGCMVPDWAGTLRISRLKEVA